MILNRQNLSENNWNHFKIVPLLTQSLSTVNCQLSIVNCQFGKAAKFQFVILPYQPDQHISNEKLYHTLEETAMPFRLGFGRKRVIQKKTPKGAKYVFTF